jgi:putative endonuclease
LEKHQNRRLNLGRSGEDAAVVYLEKNGCRVMARGFRALRGEIDIVARDGDTIVFIEVKTRTGAGFGPPEEAVTASKQGRIRRMAQVFLMKSHIGPDTPCRFDVISLGPGRGGDSEIRQVKDAF